MTSHLWLAAAADLSRHVPRLASAAAVAVDTEFVRTDTFYPRLGLLQFGLPDDVLLVDALVPGLTDTLAAPLFEGVTPPLWVVHSCAEDLEVVQGQWGRLPAGIADTQLAAAFLGGARQISLQNLLQSELGVFIAKDETRSDWCRRPLSDAQLAYAADDVRYLLQLWEALALKLRERGRMDWFEQDCRALLAKAARQVPYDQMYLQFQDAFQFKERSLAVLQALVVWREVKARELNRPRGHLLKDPVLFALAERMPGNLAALAAIPNILPSAVRRHGEELLSIIADTPVVQGLPRPPRPLSPQQRQLQKKLKAWLEGQAAALDLPVELLGARRVLEHLVRESGLPPERQTVPEEWNGWRQEVLGAGIMRVLQNPDE